MFGRLAGVRRLCCLDCDAFHLQTTLLSRGRCDAQSCFVQHSRCDLLPLCLLTRCATCCTGGGRLSVHVFHRWARQEGERDNFLLSVFGRGLQAPLIERLLELPFDIHNGVVDGEIHVAANDDATWDFPSVTGKLACKGSTTTLPMYALVSEPSSTSAVLLT